MGEGGLREAAGARPREAKSWWGKKGKKKAPGKDGWREEAERNGREEEEREGALSMVLCWPLRSHYGQERKEACCG